jgi:hypothetical protein
MRRRVVCYKFIDVILFTVRMKAKIVSEMSAHVYRPISRHIQEEKLFGVLIYSTLLLTVSHLYKACYCMLGYNDPHNKYYK